MATLPELKPGQVWCCGDRGTGPTEPLPVAFEYSRTVKPNGDGESKWERQYACKCCGGPLLLWDEKKQGFVEWAYLEHAAEKAARQAANGAGGQPSESMHVHRHANSYQQ